MSKRINRVEERKNIKRNHIINKIRFGTEISRYELQKLTNYSMTTVLNIVEQLIKDGLVFEKISKENVPGRPPTWLYIKPNGAYSIGIDFNANSMNGVLLDFSFSTVKHISRNIDKDASKSDLINSIKNIVDDLINSLGKNKNRLVGIGIGLPGLIDRNKGIGINYAYLDSWRDVPIKSILENKYKCPVSVENNVNTMAIAYRWQNFASKADDFILMTVRYGVRLGMFVNNKLYIGSGNAGEIGHVKLNGSTRQCSCGKIGCLDSEASGRAIKEKVIFGISEGRFKNLAALLDGDISNFRNQMVVDLALQGDEECSALFSEVSNYLAKSLSFVIGALNPSRAIITSKTGLGENYFSNLVKSELEQVIDEKLLENCLVESVKVDDDISAVGAAFMILQSEFEYIEEYV